MSSATVKEIGRPRIYLDAINFKVSVEVSKGIYPKKKPAPALAKFLHIQTYAFDSRIRELWHCPRPGISGSTCGARLTRVELGEIYGGPNRKENKRGIRNQLKDFEKDSLEKIIGEDEQPCDHQLRQVLHLMDGLEEDMQSSQINPRRVFKLEYYFEVPFSADPQIVRDRVAIAISKIFGTPSLCRAPADDANAVCQYWEVKAALNGKERDVQIKVYRKGKYVRVEWIMNQPGIKDDHGMDRASFQSQLWATRDLAVNQLTTIHSQIGALDPRRSRSDIAALIQYVRKAFAKSKNIEDVIASMSNQYVLDDHFHVERPVKDHQAMKHALTKLVTSGLLNRNAPQKVGASGKLTPKKRGQTYWLSADWKDILNNLLRKESLAKRRSRRQNNHRAFNKTLVLADKHTTKVQLSSLKLASSEKKEQVVSRIENYRADLQNVARSVLHRPSVTIEEVLAHGMQLINTPLTLGPKGGDLRELNCRTQGKKKAVRKKSS